MAVGRELVGERDGLRDRAADREPRDDLDHAQRARPAVAHAVHVSPGLSQRSRRQAVLAAAASPTLRAAR